MQLSETFAQIKSLKQKVFQTRDIVTFLDITVTTASKALARLAKQGHLIQLRHGLWMLPETINLFALPEQLTAPFPSYVSLQSALYYHGMIEQIPEIVYAVSLHRTKIFKTPIATISIHHLATTFYFGYIIENGVKIATPEKALLDFFYLHPTKSRWFTALPELKIPKTFDYDLCCKWLQKIPSISRKVMVENQLRTNAIL